MSEVDAILYAFRRNVVVAASAGTGKTHRLTALYLLSALGLTSQGEDDPTRAVDPITPDRIVATTFSRAAALEIRVRVERALTGVAEAEARGGPIPFAREIDARLAVLANPPSPAELSARAKQALARWGEARIDTLHGLANTLLRRHALELGLRPGFAIASEEETERLAFAVIDDALGEALSGSADEQGAVRTLTRACGGFFRARQEVLSLFNRLDDDGLSVGALSPGDHEAAGRVLLKSLTRCLADAVQGARPTIADACRDVLGALAEEAGESALLVGPRATRALTALFSIRKPPKGLSPEEVALFELRDTIGGSNAERGKRLAATLAASYDLAQREGHLLALLATIEARLSAERRRRGELGFGDLLRALRDGLLHDKAVQAAICEEIDVLMVDEFQDTNAVQRDLVYLLMERPDRARARRPGDVPQATDLRRSGLFIVGDRKQSIYAFRGADVAVFNRVASELGGEAARRGLALPNDDAANDDEPLADFVSLQTSHRSGPAIVDLVNRFSELDFGGAYGPGEHLQAADPTLKDGVTLLVDDGSPIDEPLLGGSAVDLREAFAAAAAAADAVRNGGASPRDIAVLARRRRTIPLVELALARLGLPYVVAGRALFDASEVRDLAALLHLLLDPRDRYALAHVLRGPLVALSDEALLALSPGRGIDRGVLSKKTPPFDKAALPDDHARLAVFVARFRAARPGLLRMPAAEAVSAAVSAFELDKVVAAAPRAAARLGNVDRIAVLARDKGGSLFSFSRWLDRQIRLEEDEAEAVVFSPEDDAVRLTTIHAAKGLDFPVTILVDLNVKEVGRYPTLGYHRGLLAARHKGDRGVVLESPALADANRVARASARAERSRISYVALTRARRSLVLIGSSEAPADETALATLSALEEKPTTVDAAELIRRELCVEAITATSSTKPEPTAPVAPRHLPVLPEAITIAATPLGVFRGCARRFRLRFQLGLEEPVDTGQLDLFEADPTRRERKVEPFEREEESDPRARGRAAHRVLELLPRSELGTAVDPGGIAVALQRDGLSEAESARLAQDLARFIESPFAASLARADELRREHEVVLYRPGSATGTPHGLPALTLRGTVDLYARTGSRFDVIDYKLARPGRSLASYEFQLRAYALALRDLLPDAEVRAGLVFLEAADAPHWLTGSDGGELVTEEDHERFREELAELTRALASARVEDRWPGAPLDRCRALSCGFVTACHRGSGETGPKRRPRRGG